MEQFPFRAEHDAVPESDTDFVVYTSRYVGYCMLALCAILATAGVLMRRDPNPIHEFASVTMRWGALALLVPCAILLVRWEAIRLTATELRLPIQGIASIDWNEIFRADVVHTKIGQPAEYVAILLTDEGRKRIARFGVEKLLSKVLSVASFAGSDILISCDMLSVNPTDLADRINRRAQQVAPNQD